MAPPEKKVVRMIDVANHAGCSQPAVSHVLTGSGGGKIRVSKQTADKIRQAAKELEFQPNYAARALRGKHTRTLGMISSNWRDHAQLRVFCWVQQITAAIGYQVLTAQGGTSEELQATVREFQSRGVTDVLCFAGRGSPTDPLAYEELARFRSIVSLFGSMPIEHSAHVDVDWAEGSRLTVRHLHASGRRRIGLILEHLDSPISRARIEGFMDAHRTLGFELVEAAILGEAENLLWDTPDQEQRLNEILDRLCGACHIDAIIGNDDPLAALLMQRLSARGVQVPGDVAVLGFENDLLAPHLTPALTTVNIPVFEVIEYAVNMLVARIEQPEEEAMPSKVFQPWLMVRESG